MLLLRELPGKRNAWLVDSHWRWAGDGDGDGDAMRFAHIRASISSRGDGQIRGTVGVRARTRNVPAEIKIMGARMGSRSGLSEV